MLRNIILISLLFYLISCTSSDNSVVQNIIPIKVVPVKNSTLVSNAEAIETFNNFLAELSSYQMVAAGYADLHSQAQQFLPDSTISDGFDLHIHEIGRIDSFRLVFHEYFDIYDDWSKTYFNVFSSLGIALESMKLWDLSFEGNTSINIIESEIIEIAYHDIFDHQELENKNILPEKQLFLTPFNPLKTKFEGTIYQYYQLDMDGKLQEMTKNHSISRDRNYPQASAKIFSKSELLDYSLEELKLMKEEILADNGYIFDDIQTQNFYTMQAWYQPVSKNIDLTISEIEHFNLKLITQLQTAY